MGYVIDSNTVIDYLSGQIPEAGMPFMDTIINDTPVISVITQIEVLGFNNPPEIEKLLTQFMDDSLVITLNDEIEKKLLRSERKTKSKCLMLLSQLQQLYWITHSSPGIQSILKS